jgi:AraC-like DNA-binding protein
MHSGALERGSGAHGGAVPRIRAERITTTSPEDCAARLRGSGINVRHNQMSQGGYAADIAVVTVSDDLTFAVSRYAPAITSQGTPPRHKYAFSLPLAPTTGLFMNHRPIGRDEFAIISPDREFYQFRPSQFECASFFPDAALVERNCAAMFGRSLAEICRGAPTLHATPGAAAAFARHVAQLSRAAAVDVTPLADWAAARGGPAALASKLVDDLLLTICPPEPLRGWSARQRVINLAWEIVEDDDQGVVTVSELCTRLGVPIRTLDDAFHACLGVAPKRFILGIRLNKVRRCLSHAGDDAATVTTAATRFGFFHFGHFAQQYRSLFGETPSQTLAHASEPRTHRR